MTKAQPRISLARKWVFLILLAAPVSIRADAIDAPIVLGYGLAILVPLLAFQTFLEASIVRVAIPMKWRAAAWVMLWANVWSVVAGLPTKILNSAIYDWIVPKNLYDYMRLFPAAIAVGSCVYFIVTVGVEWAYARRKLAKIGVDVRGSRLLVVIAVANVATYAVCAPIFYKITKPQHSVAEFTPDSRWAKQPAAEIFYISSDTGFPRSVRTDGKEDRLVAPVKMEGYVVSPDRTRCVYRGESDQFFDCDLVKMQRRAIPGKWEPWTQTDEVALSILGTSKTNQEALKGWSGWVHEVNWIKTPEWDAYALPGLGSHLKLSRKEKGTIVVADNPGWLHLGNRRLGNIVRVSATELLFEDREAIYLLDIERRRVGHVAQGTKCTVVGGISGNGFEAQGFLP